MLVTIRGPERSIALDLDVPVAVAATVTRNIAGVDLVLTRDNPAWSNDYINENGGMLVTLDPGRGRTFHYIADVPQTSDDEATMTLPLMAPETWLSIRRVAANREFRACSAGTIAYYAVLDGLVGLGSVPVSIGTITNASPHVDEYVFAGQYVHNVLIDMTEQSGQEWYLDRHWRFCWVPRQGRFREIGVVINDGDMQTGGSGSLHDLAREVLEVQPDGREWRVYNHRIPTLFPRQDAVRL